MNILTSYHPALLAMQSLHDQFPGALEIYTFCNDEGIRCYHTEGKNKQLFTPIDRSGKNLMIKIQQFRKKGKKIFWGDKEDLPIEKRKREIKQLSIQDEIEQNVLVFSIHSQNDDANDVFAICFSKTFSNFYIPSRHNVLSSELKKSIGATIANQIEWLYNLHKNQKENINRIQHAYQQNAASLIQTNNNLNKEQATNRDLLDKYLKQLVNKQEMALNCNIQLDAEFLNEIKDKGIEINAIEEIVNQAVLTAYDLALDKSNIAITSNLIFTPKTNSNQDKSFKLIELDKTSILLDKYETAATELTQQSLAVNGKNLAKALKISGPAITDAIKKHRHKISRLLEKSPEKWPLIIDYIKPLREIKSELLRSAQ